MPEVPHGIYQKKLGDGMFGYIVANQQEMKFREYGVYRSYYCGLCKVLRDNYGKSGQMTLSYDMTFLILLLTGLYEPETKDDSCKCVAHPLEKHPTKINEVTAYAADMNILLTYYKCLDDWKDEKKTSRKILSMRLKKAFEKIERKYPEKAEKIKECLENTTRCEAEEDRDLDRISGYSGEMMAEIFAWKHDAWEKQLRRIGFFMGKFIYLMDAYEDLENDIKNGNYNPFRGRENDEFFDDDVRRILTMMMAECCREFEQLPILQDVEILKNILYSGVWCRYELVLAKKKGTEKNDGSV